jgi:hypothetical protein
LLLKVSCNRSNYIIIPSLATAPQSGSSEVALNIPIRIAQQQRRHPTAFVTACQLKSDSITDRKLIITKASSSNSKASPQKTMDFLKRIGKVGNAVADTECLIGVDEGNAGGCTSSTKPLEKQLSSSPSRRTDSLLLIENGVIDDMTNKFPFTKTGSRWDVFTYVLCDAVRIMYFPFLSLFLRFLTSQQSNSYRKRPSDGGRFNGKSIT